MRIRSGSRDVTFETAKGREVWELPGLNEDQLRQLPMRVPFAMAAVACGFTRNAAHKALKNGTWPAAVPLTKIGQTRMAFKTDLLDYLRVSAEASKPVVPVN